MIIKLTSLGLSYYNLVSMADQQLQDYIAQERQRGVGDDAIRNALLQSGWRQHDIDSALQATPVSLGPQKKNRRYIYIVIVAVFLTGAIAIGAAVLMGSGKNLTQMNISKITEKPPVVLNQEQVRPHLNDADLLLRNIQVPDDQNAYFDLIQISKDIQEPEGKRSLILDMVAGKTWDQGVAEQIVSANTKAFEIFAQAARKKFYQDPAYANPANIGLNTGLPPLNSWRTAARFSVIRALYFAKQGNDKAAIDEVMNSVKIGQRILESQILIMEYSTALAIKDDGLEALQRIVATSKLGSVEITGYTRELDALYKNEDGLVSARKAEYLMQSRTIDNLVGGDKGTLQELIGEDSSENQEILSLIGNRYYFEPNQTKLLFAKDARALLKTVTESCADIKPVVASNTSAPDSAELKKENGLGIFLHSLMQVSLTNLSVKKCQDSLMVAATQTIMAIKVMKNETGNYPQTLTDLVPLYLSSVPIDPYDGESIKYSIDKKIVYSVGSDGQDSGGSTGDDISTMQDPTFVINF